VNLLVKVLHVGKPERKGDSVGRAPKNIFNVVLPAMLESAPRLFSRLEVGSVKACFLTMHARGRRDSHRQNQLALALSDSVSQMNPSPPAARNASR
jgi:hypothetical protein